MERWSWLPWLTQDESRATGLSGSSRCQAQHRKSPADAGLDGVPPSLQLGTKWWGSSQIGRGCGGWRREALLPLLRPHESEPNDDSRVGGDEAPLAGKVPSHCFDSGCSFDQRPKRKCQDGGEVRQRHRDKSQSKSEEDALNETAWSIVRGGPALEGNKRRRYDEDSQQSGQEKDAHRFLKGSPAGGQGAWGLFGNRLGAGFPDYPAYMPMENSNPDPQAFCADRTTNRKAPRPFLISGPASPPGR